MRVLLQVNPDIRGAAASSAKYVERIENADSAEVMREDINTASEYVFLGLRMECGIDLAEYGRRFSDDLVSSYAGDIDRLTESGLIEIEHGRLRLSQRGKLFSNEVFAVFV